MFSVFKLGDSSHNKMLVYSVMVSKDKETYLLIYDHYYGEWKWVPANDYVPVL